MEDDNGQASGGRRELKLLSLYASNFKKLQLKQLLTFPEGIVLITGLNESGKSTVLDAILYALYGRMMRPKERPSNEDIISYGTGEAQVRLEFSVGENSYRVVREVHRTRPSRAMLYLLKPDGASKTLATTVNDTTSEVERLLGGITYNEIVASSVVAQKDLERLIKQRLDDRRKVINVFLNLDSFNKVQDELDQEKSRIEGTTRNPGQLAREERELELLLEKLKEYKDRESQLSELDERTTKLEAELGESEKRFAQTDSLYKTLGRYDEALKLQESLKKEIQSQIALRDNLNQQLTSLSSKRAELEEAQRKLREFDDITDVEPRLSQASRLLEEMRGHEFQQAKFKEKEAQLASEIAEKGRRVTSSSGISENHGLPSRRVWTYLATTGALGAGTVLSYFLSPQNSILLVMAVVLGSIASISLILLARQIASLSQEADVSGKKREELATVQLVQLREKDLGEVRQNLASLDQMLDRESTELTQLLKSIPQYSKPLQGGGEDLKLVLELASSQYEKDRRAQAAISERIKLLKGQLEEEIQVKEHLREAEAHVQTLKEKFGNVLLPALPAEVVFSQDLLEEAGQFRDSFNEKVSRIRTQIEDAIERKSEYRRFLEENKDVEETVNAQQRKVGLLEKGLAVVKYSLRGLEQTSESLRNRVKPQVERFMGLILPVITSGRYKAVELDDDYTVRVFDPEAGEFRPKEVFSGGTEDQLLLAMRLAFALALLPQAKGRSPEFLFLDEPLGSSDKIRREGILKLLREQLAQNFRQIFLISHVGDLEAEADTVILMENGSVREVLSRKPSLPEPVQIRA